MPASKTRNEMSARSVEADRDQMIRFVRSAMTAVYGHCLPAVVLLACKGDASCIYYPCPLFEAVTVTVSAASGSGRTAGLAVAVGDGPPQTGACDPQTWVCHVFGAPGIYRLTLSAPGFSPQQVQVTVPGEQAGCNTCGRVDHQQLAVVLQPVP
jgi:hypothetical protein